MNKHQKNNYKYLEKINKERVENAKIMAKPVDAIPIMKYILEDHKDAEEMIDNILRTHESLGNALLERAFIEGDLKEEEWKDMKKKYNLDISTFSTVLGAYFNKKDDEFSKDEKIIIVSTPDSCTYKCRDFLKKRFGVEIIDAKEAIELMKKKGDVD